MAVSELQQEAYNPVMAFKVQGNLDPIHSTLPEDAFLLAIQSEFQRDMYQKYAGCILCIDSTHGTNAYRYKLITCIVPDHYGQGTYLLATMYVIYVRQSQINHRTASCLVHF